MLKTTVIVLGLTVVAGCASSPPYIASRTDNSVILANVLERNEHQAFALAQRHCASLGKNAKTIVDHVADGFVTFECID